MLSLFDLNWQVLKTNEDMASILGSHFADGFITSTKLACIPLFNLK